MENIRAKRTGEAWSTYVAEHQYEIIDAMKELWVKGYPYSVDLYLWETGELHGFENVGGNSWLQADGVTRKVLWSVNHEYDELPDELTWEEGLDYLNDDYFETEFARMVEGLESDEEYDHYWSKMRKEIGS